MSRLRKAFVIATVDLRSMATDRQAMFFILALPLAIILIVGFVVRADDDRVNLGVVPAASGALAAQLVHALETAPTVDAHRFATPAALDVAVRRGEVDVGVVVPAGYDRDVRAGRPARIPFVALAANAAVPAQRRAVDAITTREAAVARAARLAAAGGTVSFEDALATARRLDGEADHSRAALRTVGDRHDRFIDGVAYTAPANLILFMFINSLAAAGALATARSLGVTRRMLATPTPAGVVLTGAVLGRLAVSLLQAAVIVGAGTILFGVDWGSPLGLGALVLSFALVSTGAAVLVGATLSSLEQAIAASVPLGIGLGMLGGCMWPLAIVGEGMRKIGHVTPHAWAVDALMGLAQHRGLGAIATDLAVLTGFALVLLAVATNRLRRSLA